MADTPHAAEDLALLLAETTRLERLVAEAQFAADLAAVRARLAGATWQQLGAALGMTPKSAWKRYANLSAGAAA